MSNRREFLKFLAGSPLLAGVAARVAQDPAARVLSVKDFEPLAQKALRPQHWGYLASGVDDDRTVRANEEAYTHYQLRFRRLVDVSRIDTSIELFGAKFNSPIFLCPVGSQAAFHPDGEIASAKAAQRSNTLQVLSTQTTVAVERVNEARGGGLWYQLYTTRSWAGAQQLVRRAQTAGCPVVAVTVDTPAGRNTETQERFRRQSDLSTCNNCHSPVKPMFENLGNAGLTDATLAWDFVKRLKDFTTMKVLLKGIETREDAELAVENGADGVIVSNHGGRAGESGRGTIDCLSEVVQGTRGRIPVLLDGGVRRGTDVVKALALGASAVGVGRPYIWGLASFGQPGVERVLGILNRELNLAMGQCGARSVKEIGQASVIDTGRRG